MASRAAFPAVRWSAFIAVALPVLAGIGYMAAFGAPRSYLIVNALSLVGGAAWASLGRAPASSTARRVLALVLLAIFALPLLTGPRLDGVARWVPLGAVTLHAGMLTLPAMALLAANDRAYGPLLLLSAGAVALSQPDLASVLALAFAAAGITLAAGDRWFGLVAAAGIIAALVMPSGGELPPQPFVERVIVDAMRDSIPVGAALALALLASVLLTCRFTHRDRSVRFALAGTLAGFVAAALIGDFPTPLIGYGASAILGFALALGLRRRSAP